MRSLVLLSGGLDSAVNLAKAVEEMEVFLCLTFDYGQRAVIREVEAAKSLADYYQVPHQVIALPFLAEVTQTALVDQTKEIPSLESTELDNLSVINESAIRVWVPNRNGLFINIGAALAESSGCQLILTGFNAEEATTFPDNSPAFIKAVTKSLSYSTLNKVAVSSYTQNLNKEQIVALGKDLGLPFELIWSCYYGLETMCGRCESCQRLKRAIDKSDYLEFLSREGEK